MRWVISVLHFDVHLGDRSYGYSQRGGVKVGGRERCVLRQGGEFGDDDSSFPNDLQNILREVPKCAEAKSRPNRLAKGEVPGRWA